MGTYSNQNILKKIFKNQFFPFYLELGNPIENNLNKLLLNYPGIKTDTYRKLSFFIKRIKPKYIFFDTAEYGKLVQKIKRTFPQIIILTYFPNVEIEYAESYLNVKNPKSWLFYLMAKVNEKASVTYSDKILCVNEKDSDTLNKIYRRSADFIWRFNIKNQLTQDEIKLFLKNNGLIKSKKCLFVGTNFFGNTDGLNWFIKEVLPKVDIKLIIVGKGMSEAFQNQNKIEVHDYVEDLSEYYQNADFITLPIISGGGMKTKTAEAMMWGKAIIGTPNAFEGYEIDGIKGLYRCTGKKQFIVAINKIYSDDIFYFNADIQKHFVENYSTEVMTQKCKVFFEEIG